MTFYIGYLEILLAILSFALIRHWRLNRMAIVTSWPIIGMLPSFWSSSTNFYHYLTEILIKGAGTFEFKGLLFSNLDYVFICNPKNVNYILNKNFSNYPKGSKFKEIFQLTLGDGIFNSDFDLWKSQRKMFELLILKKNKFDLFNVKTIQRVVDGLIPILDQVSETAAEVDFQEVLQQIVFDNGFFSFFGFDPFSHYNKLSKAAYQKAFAEMEEAMFQRHFLPKRFWKLQSCLRIGSEKKLKRFIQLSDELFYQSISIKRQEYLTQKEKCNNNLDMLTIFLEDEANQQEKMGNSFRYSDKFLRDTAFNLVGAGIGATNASLTWFFYLVSKNPEVETKILEELKKHVSSNKDDKNFRFLAKQDLNNLVYLHATLCETLRLYPPVPINHKSAKEKDILPSGHLVKKKANLMISFYSMGRMKEIWGEDCLEFKPERWISKEGGFVNVPSYKLIAFNTGRRTCLGKDFAMVQMKVVAARVLWNYHVHVVEGHPVSPRTAMVLHMKLGLKVRVSKRSCERGN